MERICAKGPVLVHFFEASEASSVRSLRWIREWHERYGGLGLTVLGVHTPRSAFAAATADLEAVCSALAVRHRVANDAERLIWRDYGCHGWPSLFLWRRTGVLVWAHFGEGEYQATERSIRECLGDAELPPPAEALRPTDTEGARVIAPSDELFPGGSFDTPLEGGGEGFAVDYEAGAVYVAASGDGDVALAVDGRDLEPLRVGGPATFEVADHGTHGSHTLVITPSAGTRIWSIGFGAGIP